MLNARWSVANFTISKSTPFAEDIFDAAQAWAEVMVLAAKVWRSAQVRGLTGRTVVLKVKYADFRQITRSRTLAAGLQRRQDLERIAEALLMPLFPTVKGIRLLGVTLSSLEGGAPEGAEGAQLNLVLSET